MNDSDWLKGRETAEWLEEFLCRETGRNRLASSNMGTGGFDDATTRAMHRWKTEDSNANVYTLDRILTRYGGHLSDVPDELYIDKRFGQSGRKPNYWYPEEFRDQVVAEIANGLSKRAAARKHNLGRRTVERWVSRARG